MAESFEEYKKRYNESRNKANGSSAGGTGSESFEDYKKRYNEKREQTELSKVDTDYINRFLNSSNSFLESAGKDFESAGWDNASMLYRKNQSVLDDLNHRREVIGKWMDANRGSLDDETYKHLTSVLTDFTRNTGSVMEALTGARDFYDRDKNQDAYLQYVDHQNKMGYDLGAGQKKIDDLTRAMELAKAMKKDSYSDPSANRHARREYQRILENYGLTGEDDLGLLLGNEKNFYADAEKVQGAEKIAQYITDIQNRPDFALKSRYKSTANGKEQKVGLSGQLVETGFDDIEYDYINKNPTAISAQSANDVSSNAAFLGIDGHEKQSMNEDEIAVYNYLYATEGREAAKEFLTTITSDLNYRERKAYEEQMAVFAKDSPFGASVFSIATSPLKGISYLGQLADYASDGQIDQNENYNKFSYGNTAIRSTVAETIENSGKWGKVGSFAYNTGMSMGDFLLTTAISGGNSTIAMTIMGTGAASDTVISAKDRGLSDGQAFALGTVAGLAEAVTERVSLEALLSPDALMDGAWKYVLKNMLAEGSEEAASSVINLFGDILISKDQSEWNQSILKYMNEGKTREEAFGIVFAEQAKSIGLDALSGALSGAGMGGGGAVVNSIAQTSARNAEALELYGPDQEALVTEGLELDPDSKFAQRMQSRLDRGKDLTGGQLYKLGQHNETAMVKNDISTIQKAAESALTNYGETGDVKIISEALAKQAAGKKLSKAERTAISESKYGQRVANELNPENIQSGDFNTAWAESIGTERINAEEYGRLIADAEASPVSAESTTDAPEGSATANLTGVDRTISEEVSDSTTEADTSVSLEEASKKYGAQAKAMVATFNPGQDVGMFDRAYGFAYEMGKTSPHMLDYALNSEATSYLTPEQIEHAFNAGTAARKAFANRREAMNNAPADATGINDDNTGRSTSGKVKHKEGVVMGRDVNINKLKKRFNDPQGRAYKILTTIAKVTGINIVLYESKVGKDGKYTGDQGKFKWKNNTIYIDINAGLEDEADAAYLGKYTMLRTFTHEFTHFIEKWNPNLYNELRDLVIAEMKAKGDDVHSRIENAMEDTGLSYERASREVIAEALNGILPDTNFVNTLARKHSDIFHKLLEKFKEFLASIKEAFREMGYDPSAGTSMLQEEMDGQIKYIESIVDLFDRAAVEAVDTYQHSITDVAEQISDGIVEAVGKDGIAFETTEGDIAVVAKPSENGISDVIVDSEEWDTQHSIRTWGEDILTDDEGQNVSGKTLFVNLMKDNGYSDTDIESAVRRMDSIIEVLTNDFVAFGKLQNNLEKGITTNILNPRQRVLFSLISNGDYPVNGELSSTCVNRQAFQTMFERLVESGIMKDIVFNSAAIADMNEILRNHGYLTACFSCFVEARRVRVQKWAENFVSKWNEVAKKHGAKEQFGFFKARENAESLKKGDIFDIEEQLAEVDKNDQGNVALPAGNVKKRIDALLNKVPSLAKLLTVEDIMSVGGLTAMRRYGGGGQNVFALLKSSYGTASPKISQDFEAYGGDFAKLSFDYIKDILGKNIPGATDLVKQIATRKTEAAFDGKEYTKKDYSAEYSKNLNSAETKREALREYLYSIAGIRYQSFSDFDITQVFDKMQLFNDIAALRAPLHEYTKVVADIRIFGMTGGKMNGSVIHQVDPSLGKENAGLVRLPNGQLGYVADDRRHYEQSGKNNPHRAPQSIDYYDLVALMLDPRYAPNIGSIAIGFSDKHIRMMLDDSNIRMVIPYHRSGLPSLYMHLTGLARTNKDGKMELIVADYTDTQTASVKSIYDEAGHEVNRKSLTKDDHKKLRELSMSWKFSAHLHENSGDPVKTTEDYLAWCASDHTYTTKNGKTYHFTVTPAFEQFSDHDNYYKVLIDFDPYNVVTGEIAQQGPVTLSYAGDSDATTLTKEQLSDYRKRLEATNMFTEEQIEGYMEWARQDLMDILREELSKEQKYIESTDAEADSAFAEISSMLQDKYGRDTYSEDAVMKQYGIPAEKKSSSTSYKQSTVLFESDFDENMEQSQARKSVDKSKGNGLKYNKSQKRSKYSETETAFLIWSNGSAPEGQVRKFVRFGKTHYYEKTAEGCVELSKAQYNERSGYDAEKSYRTAKREISKIADTHGGSGRNVPGNPHGSRDEVGASTVSRQALGEELRDDSGRSISGDAGYSGGDNSDATQSQRRTRILTDHEILDMAAKELDTSKLTEGERAALDIFRKKVTALKALKEERQKQGTLYHEAQFGENRDKAKASAARNRMSVLDKQITRASAEVLSLEDKKVLKDVLQKSRKVIEQHERKASLNAIRAAREETRARERKKADERIEALRQKKNERIAEVRSEERQKAQDKVENRKKTELRAKIQKQLSELNSLLQNGNKKKNVKNGMKDTASALLAYGELLFSDDANISPETMVRNGIGTDITDKESQLLNEFTDLLEKRDRYLGQISEAASSTDENKDARIEGLQKMVDLINKKKLPELTKKLDSVFERERARLNKVTFSTVLKDLTDSYKALEQSKDPFVSGAYNSYVYDRLVAMNNPNSGVGVGVRDMSLAQLAELNDAIKMVVTSIKNANALFRDGQREVLSERAEKVFMEIRKLYRKGGDPTVVKNAVTDTIKSFAWNELKPIYAFERIGSEKFTELFWDVINGESEYGLECENAAEFVGEIRDTYGYKKWDFDKVKVFKTVDGQDFKLTLGDMMSIYAYSRRDQAHKHMFEGGFTFHTGKTETYKDTDGKKRVRLVEEDTYRMTPELLDKILSSLSKEQKAYAEAMQDYLTKLGDMGNKVSRILYGVDLFKETHYFPLKSDRDYRSTVETQLNQTQTAASLVNIGMAKETVPEASNPIVLQRFDDVAVQHIDQMLKYSSMVLPIENLRKVMDFAPGEYGTWNTPVKKLISTVHGASASQYVSQWLTDLNGSSGVDGAKNPLSSMFARSKKVAVAGNLSVVAQQYFAVARAMSEIDGKYFFSSDGKADGSQWEELKRWAGVAVIKDIGGFDMGSARSATEYIGKTGAKTSIGDKIDKAASYGSAKMDELGWGTIWKAAKAEIADTTDLKIGSDEFFKAAAKRFTEVVVKTQVYDSVTARSGFMRSKRDSVKYLVSFMGEPTTTVNMMLNAQMKLIRAKRSGNKADLKKARAYMARTSGAVILSTVLGIIAKSAVYAMRDDEETESFMERYMKQVGSSFHQELNPLNLLPVARDVMSMIQGRDIERPDMALINSTIKAFRKALKADENQVEAWIDVVLSFGNLLGVPLRNVLRDGAGVARLIGDTTDDISPKELGKTFFREGFLGKESTKNENLYAAIVSEDTGRLEVLKKGYKTDSDYTNAVRKALRECDDRIHAAAHARYEGDTMTYMEIAKEIISEGHFVQDDVVAAIMTEVTAMENEAAEKKESNPKTYSMYNAADYLSVVDQPKASKEIKDYLIAGYIEKGKTEAEAEAEFKSDVKDQVKSWYTDEESEVRISKQQATNMLTKYIGMKPDEVTSIINQWTCKVVTGIAYGDIKGEFLASRITASRAIDMRVRYGGKSREDAQKEVDGWNFEKKHGFSYSDRKAAYINGEVSASDLRNAMITYGGMTTAEADEEVKAYDWLKRNPSYDLSVSDVISYTKPIEALGYSIEQTGIKPDVFKRYKDLAGKAKGVDANGDGKADTGTKKAEIMQAINDLPISSSQKDALYYSNGWSKNTIHEAPWH